MRTSIHGVRYEVKGKCVKGSPAKRKSPALFACKSGQVYRKSYSQKLRSGVRKSYPASCVAARGHKKSPALRSVSRKRKSPKRKSPKHLSSSRKRKSPVRRSPAWSPMKHSAYSSEIQVASPKRTPTPKRKRRAPAKKSPSHKKSPPKKRTRMVYPKAYPRRTEFGWY